MKDYLKESFENVMNYYKLNDMDKFNKITKILDEAKISPDSESFLAQVNQHFANAKNEEVMPFNEIKDDLDHYLSCDITSNYVKDTVRKILEVVNG